MVNARPAKIRVLPASSASSVSGRLLALAGVLLALAAGPAAAQFAMVPPPSLQAAPEPSQAEDERAYRQDAARHLYRAYASRVYKGKLPPMMYAVMITDTEVDATGAVKSVSVARPPAAAKEVTPWVMGLIRGASPFPAPQRLGENGAVYREIWLVDKSGRFQVDSLTEGQR
jgi:protein TonB